MDYPRLCVANLQNRIFSSGRLDDELLLKMSHLLRMCLSLWQADNERKKAKELEAGSLYSFKQYGEEPETDEQLIEKLTKENFPSYQKVCATTTGVHALPLSNTMSFWCFLTKFLQLICSCWLSKEEVCKL